MYFCTIFSFIFSITEINIPHSQELVVRFNCAHMCDCVIVTARAL